MALSPEQAAALEAQVRAELWRRGDLGFKRHSGQQQIHDALKGREHFALCSRRYGKSYEGILEGLEVCLQTPGARVLYLAPWARDAALIAGDTAGKLLADCPSDLTPDYRGVDKEFVFKNGSVIRLKGTNGEHARYLRGGEAHLVILDECGQMDELEDIIGGVVMPMTLTTKGRILYLTTPPTSPGHYSVALYRRLHERGAASSFTLRDAPHIDFEEKARILRDHGENPDRIADVLAGLAEPATNYVQREYFCRFVVDKNLAVVPEFADHKSEIVVESYPRPPFFDAYGAADMGMRDRTGILSAYLDFTNQRLVIEGELLLDRANTAEVAMRWASKEAELAYQRVFLRVVDDPSLRVSADLTALGHRAQPVLKPGREAAIAAMRVAITSGRLRILSSCTQLITQLETAIYKSDRGHDFDRTEDGHFDLVDALIYLVRSVIWTRNPYPPNWNPRQLPEGMTGEWRPPPKNHSRLNQSVFGGTPAGRRLLARGKR